MHTAQQYQDQVREAIHGGDYHRAITLLDQAIRCHPRAIALRSELASLLWRLYQHDEAIKIFDTLVDGTETDVDTLLWIAKSFFSIGSFDDAVAPAARAAALAPTNPDVLAMYAGALERAGQLEAAEATARQSLDLRPNHARSVRLLAHIERTTDRLDDALARSQCWLSQHGGEEAWRVRYELVTILDRCGEYDAAMQQAVLAKQQLVKQCQPHLEQSRIIRQRQWDLALATTPELLQTWRGQYPVLEPDMRIAFLAGFPRSGTTLLEQMLACHPDCIGTDETGILLNEFIGPLVWQYTAEQSLAQLNAFEKQQLNTGRSEYLRCTESYLGAYVRDRLLIEKEPLFTPDLPMIFRMFPEATLLMPLRDPRDVVISYFFTMVPLNAASAGAISLAESCQFYADCMRHWQRWRELQLPQAWHEIRYEDLVAGPDVQLKLMTQKIGIDYRDAMVETHNRSSSKAVRTPSYTDVSQPLYQRSIGRWRNYQKYLEPELQRIEPFVREFGYC